MALKQMKLAVVMVALCAVGVSAAAPLPPPSDALNVTKTANAYEGAALYPQMSLLMGIIKGDPKMTEYLKKPDQTLTAFAATNEATKKFLSTISRYAGIALQNETFTRGVFDFMIVPGKTWTTAQLAAAAPIELKTLGGQMLKVTKDPSVPHGVRVNGNAIEIANQSTQDKKVVLHIVDGTMVPPSLIPMVNEWREGMKKPAASAEEAKAAATAASSGARSTVASVAAAAAGAAVAALLM